MDDKTSLTNDNLDNEKITQEQFRFLVRKLDDFEYELSNVRLMASIALGLYIGTIFSMVVRAIIF